MGVCQCNSSSCAFVDNSRAIGPNGANLTGGGTGGAFNGSSGDSNPTYVPFNGATTVSTPTGMWSALLVGLVGGVSGLWL